MALILTRTFPKNSINRRTAPSGLRTRYGAAHAVEGRGAFSCGAAWSGVSGTTQHAVNVRWVVPLTPLQAAPQENAPRPSTACAAP